MRIAIQRLTCPQCGLDWTEPNSLVLLFSMGISFWEEKGRATPEGALEDKDGLITQGYWEEVSCRCGFDQIRCMNVFD